MMVEPVKLRGHGADGPYLNFAAEEFDYRTLLFSTLLILQYIFLLTTSCQGLMRNRVLYINLMPCAALMFALRGSVGLDRQKVHGHR
jgi:hypothetical protein